MIRNLIHKLFTSWAEFSKDPSSPWLKASLIVMIIGGTLLYVFFFSGEKYYCLAFAFGLGGYGGACICLWLAAWKAYYGESRHRKQILWAAVTFALFLSAFTICFGYAYYLM